MYFIADFHIHSHYSIATSKNLIPEYLDYWARLKGIGVIGCGDFTHPGWLKELEEKLKPAEPGLFRLKREYIHQQASAFPGMDPRFLLTGEISSIYKKDNRVRKVHNLIFAPDFSTVRRIQLKLEALGNIRSDGRPILGLDSRDLLAIVLECSDRAFLVPAHIWTPWFSALGAKSGFDRIEECYGDLTGHVYALETGLSSDPPMNWLCSFLDRFTLISNSDAHSPEKLGREANLFETELTYDGMVEAIKTGEEGRFLGSIEFFPQEGKYHFDGHRKCGVCWDPLQTVAHGETCPVCGKKVTIGVMNRVAQLADRDRIEARERRHPYFSLIPLTEVLGEIMGCAPSTKRIWTAYHALVKRAGSEFDLLLRLPIEELKKIGNELLAEAIRRVRSREICVREGFDGEYGRITVFPAGFSERFGLQESLLDESYQKPSGEKARALFCFDLKEFRRLRSLQSIDTREGGAVGYRPVSGAFSSLNDEQRRAVEHFHGPAIVLAGPGSGKTRTLTCRIAYLVMHRGVNPEHILAFAFTNKAVVEMRNRVWELLRDRTGEEVPRISTFHSFGLELLRDRYELCERKVHFSILREDERKKLLLQRVGVGRRELKIVADGITTLKQNLKDEGEIEDPTLADIFHRYQMVLIEENVFDLDDLIYLPVKLLLRGPAFLSRIRERFRWICIDEYQDINQAQYHLIRTLMPESHSDLFVIGDPNQAIYGFRGADVRFLNRFLEDYPGAVLYKLKESYRCSDTILKASQQVVGEKDKSSFLQGLNPGVAIQVFLHPTDRSEAEFVARTIEDLMGGMRFFSIDSQVTSGDDHGEIKSLKEFAVLCRIAKQIKPLEKAFNDHGIPYQVVGEQPFFHQEPARTIIDLLKIANNPQNRFLSSTYMRKGILQDSGVERLADMLKEAGTVRNMVLRLIEKYFKSVDQPQFLRLMQFAEEYGDTLERFLGFIATGMGADSYEQGTENVTLITMHAAKGLEFGCVFIVGCEQGLIPYTLFGSGRSDQEEERRLFYVGMTRARSLLFLSSAKKRVLFGREYHLEKSPFLKCIEQELVEQREMILRSVERKDRSQLELF